MRCSFVVSAFDRPDALACCLFSLKIQTERDFEVLVTDNSDSLMAPVVAAVDDARFRHVAAGKRDCYESANLGATMGQGEYLCFPSDDGYYAPRFLELMLAGAPAGLIYCDCIYDGHGAACCLMNTVPVAGGIDKGGFLLRRELFTGFGGPVGADRAADGWLVESVVRAGACTAKVNGYLWHHN